MKKSATTLALKPPNTTNVQSTLQLEIGPSTTKVEELESRSTIDQTPGSDGKLEDLHPSAGILRDYLLRGGVEENDRIREEILRLKPARDFLGSVEIVAENRRVLASTSLDVSRITEDATLAVLFAEYNPLPLADLFGASITIAGRDVVTFPEECLPVVRMENMENEPTNGEDHFRVAFLLDQGFFEGVVRGARKDDIIRLKKDRRINAEQSQSFIIVPGDIQWLRFIGDDLRGIIRAFAPTAMYAIEPLESEAGKPRHGTFIMPRTYASLGEWRVKPLQPSSDDVALRSIVESLGGEESQMALVHENESLRNVRCRHQNAGELLETIEIVHPQGNIKLSLRDGHTKVGLRGGPFWFVPVERNTNIFLNDLGTVKCFVSGMPLELEDSSFGIGRSGDNLVVGLTSRCGTRFIGDVEPLPRLHGRIGRDDFERVMQMLRRMFRGERPFPSTAYFRISHVTLQLDVFQKTLSALGVEHEKEI